MYIKISFFFVDFYIKSFFIFIFILIEELNL